MDVPLPRSPFFILFRFSLREEGGRERRKRKEEKRRGKKRGKRGEGRRREREA